MATLVAGEDATEFKVTHLEMIKGIKGHGCFETLVVPIIENTAREAELTDRLRSAMEAYPKSCAVLVRRHGVYVWGEDWVQAKAQAESYDYLFAAAVQMNASLGLRADVAPAGKGALANGAAAIAPVAPPRKAASNGVAAVVLDIEGE